jgi:DNA mismatch endonuclease (patch repair protein)
MADNMTPQQRSLTMARIRKTDTKPELIVRRLTFARGLRYRTHGAHLLGKPDLVFSYARVVVFVDGDFWHGWRFDEWEHKLSSQYWKDKIRGNRERDVRNSEGLEAQGWTVVRIWEHDIEDDPKGCVDRIERIVRASRPAARNERRVTPQAPSRSARARP